MDIDGSFFAFLAVTFLFMAYLMILWVILGDIFRDRELGGFAKGIWIFALIFFPWITALIYFIARGKGMQERALDEAKRMQAMQQEYIRATAASANPMEQISQAKQLLDAGAITQVEFDAIKAKTLA